MGIEIDLAHEAAFELGGLVVRPPAREVARGDGTVVLQPRVMQVLVALARRRGEVVSHGDLIAACWGGRHVSDDALQRCVGVLRGVAASLGGFTIKSVARVGYRLEAADPPVAPARAPRPARRARLVGRERERAELEELIAGLALGVGGMALVSGEPGVGKSRICEEAGAIAKGRGALVLRGRSFQGPVSHPFAPLVEMLEELTDAAAALPGVRGALDREGPLTQLIGLQATRRGTEPRGVADALLRLSREQPLVLVFDDLHWVDEATAAVLRRLADRLAGGPVLILGSYRNLERDIGAPFADCLEDWVRRRVGVLIPMKGLSVAETADLVTGLASRPFARGRLVGPDPPSAQVGAIHAATGGNPFFIEELVRHLADEGRLYDGDGCVRTDIRPSELGASEGVRIVTARRLQRLSPVAGSVLAVAAVEGPQVAVDVIAAIEPGGEAAVLGALAEAESVGLVRLDSGRYSFAHDLVRQAVLATLPATRRQRLHQRIAEAIGGLHPEAPERALELGYHLSEGGAPAGDPEAAIQRLRRAGDLAMAAYDCEAALTSYRAALALLPPGAAAARADLLTRCGEALWPIRCQAESAAALEEAVDLYAQVGDLQAMARAAALAAQQCWELSRLDEAVDICRRALARLGAVPSAERALLLAFQGYFQLLLRDASGEALIDEGVRLAEQAGDPGILAQVLERRARAHDDLGEHRDSIGYTLRAIEAARRTGDLRFVVGLLSRAAGVLYTLRRWDEALAATDEAEPMAELTASPLQASYCQVIRGAVVGLRGARFATPEDRVYLRNMGDRGGGADVRATLASNLMLVGHWEEAARERERTLRAPAQRSRADVWGELLLLKARLGDRAGAETMLAERWSASASWPKYERRLVSSWSRDMTIADTLVRLGRDEEAGRFYGAFVEYARRHGPIESVLALTAAAGGRWDAAEAHFEAELALVEQLPNLVAQAEIRVVWGRALLRRTGEGHRNRARTMLLDAAARFAQMGMPRHRAEALALLDDDPA